MPYITVKMSPAYPQVSLEDILYGNVTTPRHPVMNETNTRTYWRNEIKEDLLTGYDISAMISTLTKFNEQTEELHKENMQELYDTFYIPKSKGGLRRIDAPKPELMEALRQLKIILETQMGVLYHTSAFAYVKKRSTIEVLKRHQQNQSRWFLKLDFSNFFGSTTLEFTMKMISQIFPFSEIVKRENGQERLERALSLGFLDGVLPQGTPLSPLLTNLIMIPIDHALYNGLRDFNKKRYVYTRYADDLLISSRYNFDYKQVEVFVTDILKKFEAPFAIKTSKTRYGSSCGSNWNLGLMLNKENQITVGHKKKHQFRAMINNYARDRINGVKWELHDVQVLHGILNYYRHVEKDAINKIMTIYNAKYNTDIEALMKKDISA